MGYDLFNINSSFYQDICVTYKSSDGTDVLLTDRINTYYKNDETLCQSNCNFSDYLMDSQYLKCDCDIKNSGINIKETKKFSAKSIYQSFFSVLKYSNYKVLKCGKIIFNIDSITKNIGSIISIIYFLIYFVFFIIYIIKGISQIKTDISKIIIKNVKVEENKKVVKINHKQINNLKGNNRGIENFNLKRKKKFSLIIFTYPPKKFFLNLKVPEQDSKNIINISNNKYNNILVTNKNISLKYDKKKEKIKKRKI